MDNDNPSKIMAAVILISSGIVMYFAQSDINARFFNLAHPPSAFMTYVVPMLLAGVGLILVVKVVQDKLSQ